MSRVWLEKRVWSGGWAVAYTMEFLDHSGVTIKGMVMINRKQPRFLQAVELRKMKRSFWKNVYAKTSKKPPDLCPF